MKTLSKLIAAFFAVTFLWSCGNSETRHYEKFFSFVIPAEANAEIKHVDTNAPVGNIILTNEDEKTLALVMAFPFKTDSKTMLQMQTIGGANPALREMTFGEITSTTIGTHPGWKIPMSGQLEGYSCSGEVYCTNIDNICLLIVLAGENGVPAWGEKILSTIEIDADQAAEFQTDPEKAIDAVVALASQNIPNRVDEITTWTDISIDKAEKNILLIMQIDGISASDDINGLLQEAFDANHETQAAMLREMKSSDLLISVPAEYGYSLTYFYVDSDGKHIASQTYTADEL